MKQKTEIKYRGSTKPDWFFENTNRQIFGKTDDEEKENVNNNEKIQCTDGERKLRITLYL